MPYRSGDGIDAPAISIGFTIGGLAAVMVSMAIPSVGQFLIWPAASFLAAGAVMLYGSVVGKLRLRDRVLNALTWNGDESVLDIGCGHGLLVIGAAKKLTTGKAVGIDLWRSVDQAQNSRAATQENVAAAKVADRVELVDGDARELPFPDQRFDVVLSSFAIHNIPDVAGREKAIREAMRVLKPGGHLEIVDIFAFRLYRKVLEDEGWPTEARGPSFIFVTPTMWIRSTKPG